MKNKELKLFFNQRWGQNVVELAGKVVMRGEGRWSGLENETRIPG